MPVIKSAIKKLRKDVKREKANSFIRAELDKALNTARKQKTEKAVKTAISEIDKAVKKNLMHANKAARMKSSLSKVVRIGANSAKSATKTASKVATKTAEKVVKKAAAKSPKK
ncbi:MAG TPA: 30S ribosomal protein S20 [Patescibacteria group bacterium]|nr:30S ribosomal protein S20 [Patescibacteria group bacterium]